MSRRLDGGRPALEHDARVLEDLVFLCAAPEGDDDHDSKGNGLSDGDGLDGSRMSPINVPPRIEVYVYINGGSEVLLERLGLQWSDTKPI